jgi:hypothetical protein
MADAYGPLCGEDMMLDNSPIVNGQLLFPAASLLGHKYRITAGQDCYTTYCIQRCFGGLTGEIIMGGVPQFLDIRCRPAQG